MCEKERKKERKKERRYWIEDKKNKKVVFNKIKINDETNYQRTKKTTFLIELQLFSMKFD